MSEAFVAQHGAWSSGRAWLERKRRAVLLVMLVLMFVIAALAPRIFITVPSGHGGILWLRFFGGTQTSQAALGEGLHVIMPWDHIFIYDMRVQEREQSYQVMAREGLQITVRSSFRWQLNRANLARLHKEIGPNYLNVLLVPEIGSVVRERMSQYNTEELFSSRRTEIQAEILKAVVAETPGQASNRIGGAVDAREGFVTMSEDFVTLTDVLLKDVTLPFRVRSAVERKLEQAQITQEYSFRIEREKLESQRKQIEAQGIQAFQQTVQAGISENYLKWRGIEATLQLAQSPNSKVVIVGGGSNGLPLILNTADTAAPPRAPQTPANPANPVKVQKASVESGGQAKASGSVDPTPPQANALVDELIAPGSSKQSAGNVMRLGSPLAEILDKDTDDAPPYILQSFADAFGYRLQKISPFTAEVIRESERPR
jgi:regulator of protease activity HflC (stomatin/prohibitin superfamily)